MTLPRAEALNIWSETKNESVFYKGVKYPWSVSRHLPPPFGLGHLCMPPTPLTAEPRHHLSLDEVHKYGFHAILEYGTADGDIQVTLPRLLWWLHWSGWTWIDLPATTLHSYSGYFIWKTNPLHGEMWICESRSHCSQSVLIQLPW